MVIPGVLQFFRRSGPLQHYHSTLREHIEGHPLLQMLPSLINLPLFSTDGYPFEAADTFTYSPMVALSGAVGSGRSLALAQVAWHFAQKEQSTPVLTLPLAHVDIPAIAPRAVVSTMLDQTGLPMPIENNSSSSSQQPWILLIDGWETLPPPRRDVWRAFLLALPKYWPGAQVVITLPNMRGQWGGFQIWSLAGPDQHRRKAWLSHLLPNHDVTPLLKNLRPGGTLDMLGQRLRDLLLLALTYPNDGLPTTRDHLYQRAHTLLHSTGNFSQNHGHNRMQPDPQNLIALSHVSPLRHYDIARGIAHSNNIDQLDNLEDIDRAEVGLLLSGLLTDVQPLFRRLWDMETEASLLSLIMCFREHPAHIPDWGIEVLEVVAAQTTQKTHQRMLVLLAPVLPTLFKTASDAIDTKRLCRLLARVAPVLPTPALLALLDDGDILAVLRWIVVDVLLQQVSELGPIIFQAPPPPDDLSRAARGYMLVLGNSTDRQLLANDVGMADWITALQNETVPHRRRLHVAHTLLNDLDTTDPLRAAAFKLLTHASDEDTMALLKRMGANSDHTLRHMALDTLQSRAPQQSLDLLGSILLSAESSWEAQHDALKQIAMVNTKESYALLVRAGLGTLLSLELRGQALVLLAHHSAAASNLLLRLSAMETLPPVIRATTVHLLALRGETRAIPLLCRVAAALAPTLVRQAAVAALGLLGKEPAVQPTVLAGLQAAFAAAGVDPALKIAILQALGTIATPRAIPLLRNILEGETFERVHTTWLTLAPTLEETPVTEWQTVTMPNEAQQVLLDMLSEGSTDAENPTSFQELVEQSVSRVRLAAIDALVQTGLAAPPNAPAQLRPALQALLFTLFKEIPAHEARPILAGIAQLSTDGGRSELHALLNNQTLSPLVRWLAIENLGSNPNNEAVLVRTLQDDTLDSFIKGHVALVLGQHHTSRAVLALRNVAGQVGAPEHLRTQAVLALSPIADPIAAETLLSVVMDTSASATLRGTAARALPTDMPTETRRWLREVLRREHEPPDLITGVLMALGQARDQESLVHMLRYAQSEQSAVALAALEAIAQIGDSSVAPTLVHISQSTVFDEPIRLQAVIALLRLCGAEYLPFLRRFLDSPVLPLQLQALDCLLSLWPDEAHTLVLVANQAAPLVLRLRALEELTPAETHLPTLCDLLLNRDEAPALRLGIASLVGRTGHPEAVATLAQCLGQPDLPITLQRRCVAALATLAQHETTETCVALAHHTLGLLAEDMALPDAARSWSSEALYHLLVAQAT